MKEYRLTKERTFDLQDGEPKDIYTLEKKVVMRSSVTSELRDGNLHCTSDTHVYPEIYAGDPLYAEEYFNTCICGKKMKITTVKEVDVEPPKHTRGKHE